jgi:hypothetical protein
MTRIEREMLWGAVVIVSCMVGLGALAFWLDASACHARFAGYGETRYQVIGGCMVKHKDQWKPAEVFREVGP